METLSQREPDERDNNGQVQNDPLLVFFGEEVLPEV